MENNESCPICGKIDFELVGKYRSVHLTFSKLNRVKCKACGMVFATPMPSEDKLRDYNSTYFDSAHGGKAESLISTAFFSAIAGLRAQYVGKYIDKNKIQINKILEIGPGPGFFAEKWITANPLVDYLAMETDSSCYDSLLDRGVRLITDEELQSSKTMVDMVVMSHVLEHVSNPFGFISFLTNHLRQDGILFIEVPCNDWEHKSLDEPHLLFFDKKQMTNLLSTLGFCDIEVSYHGEQIDELKLKSFLDNKLNSVRSKLISLGLIWPFSRKLKGMESLLTPLERAVVAPFKAHQESNSPAWWLRAVARKK
jgi:hypothetical protein